MHNTNYNLKIYCQLKKLVKDQVEEYKKYYTDQKI